MKRKSASYGLTVLSCFMINPAVYAGAMGEKPSYPDGWVFIAGAGETAFMTAGAYTVSANDMIKSEDARSFQFGVMGDLAVGYGKRIHDPFYLGTEAGVIFFGNRKTTSKHAIRDTTVVTETFRAGDPPVETATVNHMLSSTVTVSGNVVVPYFDLKPGVLLSDNSFLFGRIGVDYNQMTVTTRASYGATGRVVNSVGDTLHSEASAVFSKTHKKELAGLRTGLGFEYLLTENIGLSANYIYAFYSGLNVSASGSSPKVSCDVYEGCPVRPDGTYSASGHSKMSNQQVLLELNYHLT